MKDEDFIERKEKVLLAALGKSWLWKSQQVDNRHYPSSGCACNAGSLHSALVRHSGKTHGVYIRLLALRLHCLDHHQPSLWLLLGASGIHYLRSADFILHRLSAFFRVRYFSPAAAAADGRPRAAALLRLHQEKGLE